MARKLRVEFPGAIYHVMSRGDRRKAIFLDDVDRRDFLAERIVAEELARLGWSQEELEARRKSDPAKLAMAARLRQETALTIKAIAARLHLGTSKSANARLHGWMRSHGICQLRHRPIFSHFSSL